MDTSFHPYSCCYTLGEEEMVMEGRNASLDILRNPPPAFIEDLAELVEGWMALSYACDPFAILWGDIVNLMDKHHLVSPPSLPIPEIG